ncbi:MAG: phosphodiester glycosidase family protein [Selenomonadaceae bacterium]|nr:phosphodiester glycosidase family protein [Selenomonadaceae bacterium]
MIKKFAALLAAGIFFLSAPVAQAEESVDKPFAEEKNPPEEKWTPPVYKPTPPAEEEPPSVDKPFTEEKNPPEEETKHPPLESGYYEPPVYEEGQKPPQTSAPPPVEEVEGLEFLVYHQDGVMAFAVIADHEKYFVRPVLARGQVPGRATVSQMNAPDAIATINASYFAVNGVIIGNTKIDGLTAGTDYFIRSAVGIKEDGSTIFARQTYRGVLQFNGEEVVVDGVDCERNSNTVVVYNGWYGATTGTNNFGVEFVVQDGVVVNISRERGNNYIPPNGFVVSAHGTAAEKFKGVYVGDKMIFDEDFINVEHGEDFNEAIHIIGAGPTLVKDGEIYVTADAEQFPNDIRVGRAPRSAFGITQYGDYIFAVVDGRQAHSKGCTLTEWARILKNNFGAVEAINLDGGGSTELFFKGKLVNSPSDGRERLVGDALTILRK